MQGAHGGLDLGLACTYESKGFVACTCCHCLACYYTDDDETGFLFPAPAFGPTCQRRDCRSAMLPLPNTTVLLRDGSISASPPSLFIYNGLSFSKTNKQKKFQSIESKQATGPEACTGLLRCSRPNAHACNRLLCLGLLVLETRDCIKFADKRCILRKLTALAWPI